MLLRGGGGEWLHDQRKLGVSYNQEAKEVHRLFGSLPKTLYCLIQSMLDGIAWGRVSDALMDVNIPPRDRKIPQDAFPPI